MTAPDPREDKLPRWVRETLADLRGELHRQTARAEAARLASDPATSTAVMDPYDPTPVGLGRDAQVRFLPVIGYPLRWVDVRVADGAVRVMASSTLAVVPQAANVVHLSVR